MIRKSFLLPAILLCVCSPIVAQERSPASRNDDSKASEPLLPRENPPVFAAPDNIVAESLAAGSLMPLTSLPDYLGSPLAFTHPAIRPLPTFPVVAETRCSFGVDYLLWWYNRSPIPAPLLSTGPDTERGARGEPGSVVLVGQQHLPYSPASGLRVRGEWYCIPEHQLAVEGSFLFFERVAAGVCFHSNGNGDPQLARPYLRSAGPTSLRIAFPGRISGDFDLATRLSLKGGEFALTGNIWEGGHLPEIRWALGFRSMDLHESMRVQSNSTALANDSVFFLGQAVPVGGAVSVFDAFTASNHFYGLQLGTTMEHEFSDWLSLTLRTRVAIGPNVQQLDTEGTSSLRLAPGVTTAQVPGGLLALPSNIRQRNVVRMSVIPEVGLGVNARLNDWVFVRLGYNWMYWTAVLRGGRQADDTINRSQIPTAREYAPTGEETRPRPLMQTGEFWAHGLTLGMEVRY